jgi:hypothetical protein
MSSYKLLLIRQNLLGHMSTARPWFPPLIPVLAYPLPLPTPPGVTAGYGDEVIFADGTFIDGSTGELSADGPIRPPYVVYCQVSHGGEKGRGGQGWGLVRMWCVLPGESWRGEGEGARGWGFVRKWCTVM